MKRKRKTQTIPAPNLKQEGRKYTLSEARQVRQYGINDLKNYILKLKKNIKVFDEAIKKEKLEIRRTRGMIMALQVDRRKQREIQIKLKRGIR